MQKKKKHCRKEKKQCIIKSSNKNLNTIKTIGESIKEYDDVLLFGPTNAKIELLNILEADLSFSKIKIETRQADKMTENQEHAFVKDYFSKRGLAL